MTGREALVILKRGEFDLFSETRLCNVMGHHTKLHLNAQHTLSVALLAT